MLFKGRELTAGASLAEQGVGSGAVLTAVRRVLVADGWKVRGAECCPALSWVAALFLGLVCSHMLPHVAAAVACLRCAAAGCLPLPPLSPRAPLLLPPYAACLPACLPACPSACLPACLPRRLPALQIKALDEEDDSSSDEEEEESWVQKF